MMFPSFNARAMGLTLSADETLRLASENGFGGVDLMVRDLVEQRVDLAELKRKMDDLGLEPGAFPFPFDWRVGEEQFLADLHRLPAYLEAAASLGLRRTGTWVMPEVPRGEVPAAWMMPEPPSPDRFSDQTWEELHAVRLARIVRALRRYEIRLGLEVIGPQTSRPGLGPPFIHDYESLERHRRRWEGFINIPIGVLLDCWHLYATGETLAQVLTCGIENVVWVHIADLPAGDSPDRSRMIDAVRGLPGEHGAIDSRSFLRELKAQGYDGPITAEPLARCRSLAGLTPDDTARAVARSLRAAWPI